VTAPRAVIFDFDGTLFQLATDYPALREALSRELPALFGPPQGVAAGAVTRFLTSLSAPERPRVLELLAQHEALGVQRGAFYPDARRLLAALEERGAPFAIYTRNCQATIRAAFADATLPKPAAVVALDDEVPPKPDLAATRLLLARLGYPAERCVMIGDTDHDMKVGADLEIPRVLRINPALSRVPVDAADRVVRSFAELDLSWLLDPAGGPSTQRLQTT
jgi:mannitol-1-/sugar-/sorbitol-6-phosphatase